MKPYTFDVEAIDNSYSGTREVEWVRFAALKYDPEFPKLPCDTEEDCKKVFDGAVWGFNTYGKTYRMIRSDGKVLAVEGFEPEKYK